MLQLKYEYKYKTKISTLDEIPTDFTWDDWEANTRTLNAKLNENTLSFVSTVHYNSETDKWYTEPIENIIFTRQINP